MKWTVGILACLAAFVLVYPVLDRWWFSNGRAYHWVLSFHAKQGHRNGVGRLLYVSWFPDGRPKFARDCALYSDGLLLHDRVAWGRGVTGEGGWINETPNFTTLRSLPPLPAGLPSDGAVPCGRLLIVSRLQAGVWITRDYDREHLPVTVQQILWLTGLSGGFTTPTPSTCDNSHAFRSPSLASPVSPHPFSSVFAADLPDC